MAAAAAWAVVLYMRSQRPAWITIGAGARIGLVTGLLGAWVAAAATGSHAVCDALLLHQGKDIRRNLAVTFATTSEPAMDSRWVLTRKRVAV